MREVGDENSKKREMEPGKIRMTQAKHHYLEIWKYAIDISLSSIVLAYQLEDSHLDQVAGQLKEAALSIYVNISEGTEAVSEQEHLLFLNSARRSLLKLTRILIHLNKKDIITCDIKKEMLYQLEQLNQKISSNSALSVH